ncbi:NYN domain-containing protein [Ensifer adhaerens]|uniref:NYN domain-containing protein n=1 Tax=Ensifer adhaerens TaxID=106592 RepID=UPI001CBC5025|nr:NYN domain-containing protein [Ensifer adhaerens]MBZ7922684.1 NYN domain-containing protein [Ensifer adhaerens]UAX91298.1 NYN domain-containing protein [Ensifer adhaerens]UAX98926.1 NYN domain-containing protein [Ensifer adhaerens]UAY06309.1 NYN domain-containing protein [Ensifer adhaerens]
MGTGSEGRRDRLAILIDAENVRPKFLPLIILKASSIGTASIKRDYGNFGSAAMAAWQPLLHEYALLPVHVAPAAKSKNATDLKLAIDAIDILHRRQIEGFCIASSDSDFTSLASRIREDGLAVYGFGEKKATNPYVKSCDRFFYCDLLLEEGAKGAAGQPAKLPLKEIHAAVDDTSGEDGWAYLGEVGNVLNKRMPDFDSRLHGFSKLNILMKSIPSLECKSNGGGSIYVKRK